MSDKLSDLKLLALSVSIFEDLTGSVSSVVFSCLVFGLEVMDDGEAEAEAW